jgi:hypothetical protein
MLSLKHWSDMNFIIILIVAIFHISALVLYPETTVLGPTYLFVSFLLWSAFFLLLKSSFYKLSTKTSSFIFIVIAIAMLLSIMFFYPQRNNKPVFYKLLDEEYPDRFTIYRGFKKLGINIPQILPEKKK